MPFVPRPFSRFFVGTDRLERRWEQRQRHEPRELGCFFRQFVLNGRRRAVDAAAERGAVQLNRRARAGFATYL